MLEVIMSSWFSVLSVTKVDRQPKNKLDKFNTHCYHLFGLTNPLSLWVKCNYNEQFSCLLIAALSPFCFTPVLFHYRATHFSSAVYFTSMSVTDVQQIQGPSALSIDVWSMDPWLLVPLSHCTTGLQSTPSWDLHWERDTCTVVKNPHANPN